MHGNPSSGSKDENLVIFFGLHLIRNKAHGLLQWRIVILAF
jgi:hypothetical protein